jgi:hypothetical protein
VKNAALRHVAMVTLLSGAGACFACKRAEPEASEASATSSEAAPVASAPKPPPAPAEPEQATEAPRAITKARPTTSAKRREPAPEAAVGRARDTLDRDLERAEGALVEAWHEFERAAEELKASGSDCERACQALGSMQRAATRICALEPASRKGSRCPEARERLAKARQQVSSSCGVCPE